MSTNIVGTFPPELWHMVCRELRYKDLTNVRLTCRALAVVAAEYLVSKVRFQTTLTSFKRLQALAEHPQLRKNVKSLVYEACLMREPPCIHLYSMQFEGLKPRPPPDHATDRTTRLYGRNLDKFNRDIRRKFDKVCNKFQAQQRLINDVESRNVLFQCIASFPSLNSLKVATDPRCVHAVSARFREEYEVEFPMGNAWPNANSIWQLQNCLVMGLSELAVESVSPLFFDGLSDRTDSWLQNTFSSLKSIRLSLRGSDITSSTSPGETFSVLQDGRLKRALGAAQQLRSLVLNLEVPLGGPGPYEAGSTEHIFGQHVWPYLEELEFHSLRCASEDELMGMLARQPKLSVLRFDFLRLEQGEWTSVTRKMREQLKLKDFFSHLSLEDQSQKYSMSACDRDAWLEGYDVPLWAVLADYITNPHLFDVDVREAGDDVDMEELHYIHNPLYRFDDDFDDTDELVANYGPIPGYEALEGSDCTEDIHGGQGDNDDEEDEDDDADDDEISANPWYSDSTLSM